MLLLDGGKDDLVDSAEDLVAIAGVVAVAALVVVLDWSFRGTDKRLLEGRGGVSLPEDSEESDSGSSRTRFRSRFGGIVTSTSRSEMGSVGTALGIELAIASGSAFCAPIGKTSVDMLLRDAATCLFSCF